MSCCAFSLELSHSTTRKLTCGNPERWIYVFLTLLLFHRCSQSNHCSARWWHTCPGRGWEIWLRMQRMRQWWCVPGSDSSSALEELSVWVCTVPLKVLHRFPPGVPLKQWNNQVTITKTVGSEQSCFMKCLIKELFCWEEIRLFAWLSKDCSSIGVSDVETSAQGPRQPAGRSSCLISDNLCLTQNCSRIWMAFTTLWLICWAVPMGMNISEMTHVGIEQWFKRNTEVWNSLLSPTIGCWMNSPPPTSSNPKISWGHYPYGTSPLKCSFPLPLHVSK